MHERLRHTLLAKWAAIVCTYPKTVLVTAVLIAAASIAVTVGYLTFQPDRNDLLSRKLDWNKRFIALNKQFKGNDDLIIGVLIPQTVDGDAVARDFLDELGARLTVGTDVISEVYWRVHLGEISPKMLMTLSEEDFAARVETLKSSPVILNATSIDKLLENVSNEILGALSQLNQTKAKPAEGTGEEKGGVGSGVGSGVGEGIPPAYQEQVDAFMSLMKVIERGFEGRPVGDLLDRITLGEKPYEYLVSDDKQMLFMFVEPKLDHDAIDAYIPTIEFVRGSMDELKSKAEYQKIEAGVTGIAVIESDETLVSISDSTRCSIIAISMITLLVILAFHSWRMPLLAVLSLLLGVAWSFGFLTLAIGHLQVLSVVFTVILLGLGIDFGIHLISAYELVRTDCEDGGEGCVKAMQQTMQVAAPGIITGAVTTSVAFAATLLTDFQGMAEMGLIAGVGILLCLIVMLSVLPALIRLFRPQLKHIKPHHERILNFHGLDWVTAFTRKPILTIAFSAVIMIPAGMQALKVPFDYNLQHLQPEGVEPVVWQNHINEHHQAILSAVSVTKDLEQAKAWTRALQEAETVASLGGIAGIFPEQIEKKKEVLDELRAKLGDQLTDHPPAAEKAPEAQSISLRLSGFQFLLRQASNNQAVKDNPVFVDLIGKISKQITQANQAVHDAMNGGTSEERSEKLHETFIKWRVESIEQIEGALEEREMRPEDLPMVLRRDGVSITDDVKYAIRIFPKEDIWQPEHLTAFIEELREIDPKVTGVPVQLYESSLLIQTSYANAGIYALLAVFVLVLIDFRNVIDAVLTLLPVLFGFVGMFAMMQLFGVPINLANIIVLPLLFGVGVDCGVHIMHRFRQTPELDPPGLALGTGKGILMTTLTTMIGFGTMMLAHHRGIQSLGFVLAVGMGITMIGCVLFMPSVLTLYRRFIKKRSAVEVEIPKSLIREHEQTHQSD